MFRRGTSGNDVGPEDGQRWRSQRVVLDRIIRTVQSRLSSELFLGVDVHVSLEPASEPPEGAIWHWSATFTIGDEGIEAIPTGDGDVFYFEDDQGYFEDGVNVNDLAEYLQRRAVQRD